jgi:hypothetical protein
MNKGTDFQRLMEYAMGMRYKDPYTRVISFSFGVMELTFEKYAPDENFGTMIMTLSAGLITKYRCEIENPKFRLTSEFIKDMETKGIRFSDDFKDKYLDTNNIQNHN